MSSLTNKRILLGVTGGIAAYKSAELIRKIRERGANVQVVMTQAAQAFITPLTLQALSGNPVHTELLDPEAEAGMGHIELARWADAILIAPLSADFISKLVVGEGSDLLSTLCLASSAPMILAPAMNQAMWKAYATQENIGVLSKRGHKIIGPASGEQACGDVGLGRMEEPEAIAQSLSECFETGSLAGKTVVITAGPTREAIDPVRYISNHSSGKMGYALAQAAMEAGASVTLISGPVSITPPDRVECISVVSALDMYGVALARAERADIFIGTAAVADYRVAEIATQKIKKKGEREGLQLHLLENPDVIAAVSALKSRPFTVGFAAETENLLEYARKKKSKKNLDMIIANDVSNASIGFNSEHNAVTLIGHEEEIELALQSKTGLARRIITVIARHLR